MTAAQREKLWPYLSAGIVAAAVCAADLICGFDARAKAIPTAFMTFGIVAAGFIGAQRTMLLPMSTSKVMRVATKAGIHVNVLQYLREGIWAGLTVVAVASIGLVLGKNDWTQTAWLAAVSGNVALVLFLIMRAEQVMHIITRKALEEAADRKRRSS